MIPFLLLTIEKIWWNFNSRKWEVEFSAVDRAFWAVSHSWAEKMCPELTEVNNKQWPVLLPYKITLHSVRSQLIHFGGHYAWLDVLCLRQGWAESTHEFQELVKQEWKLDVPTIGNVYRIATTIVRYFNGLGCDFSSENWDDHRHWLQRAWTLQELRPEDITHNGGTSDSQNIWNITGLFQEKETTLRELMTPLWKLAEDLQLNKRHGEIYRLVKEMRRRFATNDLGKVSGLFYLLGTSSLPQYFKGTTAGEAWERCFHVLPNKTQLEFLFEFPYPGTDGKWFPSWKQLLNWPDRGSALRHLTRRMELIVEPAEFDGCEHLDPKYKRQLLCVKGLSILPNVTIEHANDNDEYIIQTSRVIGNFPPRTTSVPQKRIHFQSVYQTHERIPEGLYFLITPQPSTLHNSRFGSV